MIPSCYHSLLNVCLCLPPTKELPAEEADETSDDNSHNRDVYNGPSDEDVLVDVSISIVTASHEIAENGASIARRGSTTYTPKHTNYSTIADVIFCALCFRFVVS